MEAMQVMNGQNESLVIPTKVGISACTVSSFKVLMSRLKVKGRPLHPRPLAQGRRFWPFITYITLHHLHLLAEPKT